MHKYAVDQTLDLLPSHGSSTRRAAPCRIVALLPYEGRLVQYKVQSSLESYQRIVSENDLRVPAAIAAAIAAPQVEPQVEPSTN